MALQPLLATLIVATLGLTAYVGSVSREVRQLVYGTSSYAQTATSCTADQIRCYSSSTDTVGWCQMSPCPTQMTTPPATNTGPASCTGGQIWCTSSSGSGGWCQMSPCPTQTNTTTTCPIPPTGCMWGTRTDPAPAGSTCPLTYCESSPMDQASCASKSGNWCTSSTSSSGWCQQGTCPTSTTPPPSTCPSGQMMCPAMGSSPAGCYTTCPTSTPVTTCTATQSWCPSSASCLPIGSPCGTTPIPSTCPAGQVQCPAIGTSPAGCYTTCPTSTQPTACTTGQILCYNSAVPPMSYCYTGTICPSPNPSCPGMYSCPAAPPATGYTCSSTPCSTTTGCSTGQQWCPPSGGTAAGYCAATCLTPLPTGPTPESCKAQNQFYCAPTSPATGVYPGTMMSGWCSSTPCSQSECVTAGKKWCPPGPAPAMSGPAPSGWCTEKTNTCPAYTATDCTAQGGKWCKNQMTTPAMSGSDGWCQTGGGTCPAYDAASCTAQSGSWCQPLSGGMGWCATPPSTCPNENKDKLDCAARGSEWCTSMGGGTGWCQTGGARCPANDPATCTARSGKWCKNPPSIYATTTNMPSGWCSEPPSGGSATSTYWKPSCPIYDASECKIEGGLWCTGSYGSGGYCWTPSPNTSPPPGCTGGVVPPGPKVCPLMPYIQCPNGYKEVVEKTPDGCMTQRCIKPGGEDLPIYCPAVMPPPCPGGTLEAKKSANNCPIYECRASECKPPPPAEHCVTGWQPVHVPGLNCPRYDCPNTDHNRMEECVLKAIGKEAFERMKKKGEPPTDELMLKMGACFPDKPRRPPGPRPPGEPPFPDQCPLADMKREMQRGMTRELDRIDREVDRFRRQGVEIPVSYEGLLAKVKLIISQASDATSCEEMYTFGRDLPNLMRQLHEEIQGIEQLARVNEVVKKFNDMLRDVERDGKRAIRRVPKDLRPEMEKEFSDRIAELKAAIAAVKSAAASNDPDKIEAASQQAFEQLERARQTIQVAEMLRQARRVLNAGRSDIRRAEKLIKELEPADSADLAEALDEFKLVYAEALRQARTCAGTKATDACADLFERYLVAWDDLKDTLDDATGENDFEDFLGISLGKGLIESKTLNLLEGVR